MAEKLHPIKWLEGVLHLNVKGRPVRIVGPGEIIKDAEELAALGVARIEALIAEGKCVWDNVVAELKTPPLTEAEKADAQAIAQESADSNASAQRLAQMRSDRATATGTEPAARDLKDVQLPPQNGSRGTGGAGPIAAGSQT